jgi:hypothetical protein
MNEKVTKIVDIVMSNLKRSVIDITDQESFKRFLTNLGLKVTATKISDREETKIIGRLELPFDMKVFSNLGSPQKFKEKGKNYYKYIIKDKGELTVSPDSGHVSFYMTDNLMINSDELVSLLKTLGIKVKKTDIGKRYGENEGHTVSAYISSKFNDEVLKALKSKYNVKLVDGFGTPGKNNYAWSEYRWTDPKYGLMRFWADRRSFDSYVQAFNVDSLK